MKRCSNCGYTGGPQLEQAWLIPVAVVAWLIPLSFLAVGYWPDLSAVRDNWQLDRKFTPQMEQSERETRYARWREAVERSRGWETKAS